MRLGNIGRYIFYTYYFMKFTEAMTTFISLVLYITNLWLCSEYIVIPCCGFFPWGWVSLTVLAGRQCCIDDAVGGLVFNFFTLLTL